jgi:hypothetical protein
VEKSLAVRMLEESRHLTIEPSQRERVMFSFEALYKVLQLRFIGTIRCCSVELMLMKYVSVLVWMPLREILQHILNSFRFTARLVDVSVATTCRGFQSLKSLKGSMC